MGNTWDGGLEREYPDTVEYCDILFFDACDVGLCSVVRRADCGGEVISGGRDG